MAASYPDRAVYYRALSALLGAGAPAAIALKAAGDGLRCRSLREAATDAAFRAGSGMGVGEALAHHPDVFEESDVALLRAAESMGDLDGTLHRLAEDADAAGAIRRRLVAGFIYPVVLWHFAAVVPPLRFLILDGIGAWFVRALALLFPLYLILAVLWWLGTRQAGRIIRGRMLGAVPFLGKALQRASLARFLRVLGGSLNAGMGAVTAATTAFSSTTQADLRRGAREGIGLLADGRAFVDFFAAIPGLSANDRSLLASGDLSGRLTDTLRHLAEQKEESARLAAESAVRYLPLAVYLLVAAYIAWTVITLYTGQIDALRGF